MPKRRTNAASSHDSPRMVELEESKPQTTSAATIGPTPFCGATNANVAYELQAVRDLKLTDLQVESIQMLKDRARRVIAARLQRGTLERQPCSECGAKDAQAHHRAYSRPHDVIWLCAACHGAHHKRLRAKLKAMLAHSERFYVKDVESYAGGQESRDGAGDGAESKSAAQR